MFQTSTQPSGLIKAFQLAELIYHATVRHVRKDHGNALIGLCLNMLQTVMLVIVFYIMFQVLGMRGSAIRGDFLIYIMSGIFLFMCQSKALAAVMGAEGPASPMMNHAPMNTIVSLTSAALSSLYIQVLSMFTILLIYHVAVSPVTIDRPIPAFGMVLLSWFSGCAFGMVFFAMKPWAPGFTSLISQLYLRANMIASGKMFVANTMPGYLLVYFTWNPLFHTIDQARGFAFINYNPHFSNIPYPIYISILMIVVGLMGEFYTRRQASISWGAKQ